MPSWQNGSLKNGKMTKWQIDKMGSWQRNKLSRWQNGKLIIWHQWQIELHVLGTKAGKQLSWTATCVKLRMVLKNWTTIKCRLKFWPPDASKWYAILVFWQLLQFFKAFCSIGRSRKWKVDKITSWLHWIFAKWKFYKKPVDKSTIGRYGE